MFIAAGIEVMTSTHLLLRRTAAPSRCLRSSCTNANANASGILFANYDGTSWPTPSDVAAPTIPAAAAIFAESAQHKRYKSTLACKGAAKPSSSPSSSSTANSNKHVEWDGLANGKRPALNHVRSFPIIGSAIPLLSGTPNINPITNAFEYWTAMRNKFGEFYTLGNMIAGDPDDIYRMCYIVNDPREVVKIIRAGGKFPSGLVENLWVNQRWFNARGFHVNEGIHGRGEEWRRVRTFLQTDLLHPDSANGYLPGILRASELASKGARAAAALQSSGEQEGALNSYLHRCAFDMFSSLAFGIYTETADVTTHTKPENQRFVDGAVQGLATAIQMMFSPYENIVGRLLKFETAKMKHSFEGYDAAWAVAQDKIGRFIQRKERGELFESEQASYLSRALDRQKEEGSNVSEREAMEIVFAGMFAAVDTTSSVLGWNLFHIARSPRVQEKLFREISASVEAMGRDGKITAEALNKSNAPYLHAVIRETHRMTPATMIMLQKTVDVDNLEVHGRKMERGNVVLLEGYTSGNNPNLVENPEEFLPERWLRDAVDARKGSPSEIIDHPFLASPFSQGARKCPGSRVASNEIKAMLSQLVLDWKISSSITELKEVRYKRQVALEVILPNLKFEAR